MTATNLRLFFIYILFILGALLSANQNAVLYILIYVLSLTLNNFKTLLLGVSFLIPLFFLLFIGMLSFGNNPDYFFLRDIWFILKTILLTLTGINLCYGINEKEFIKICLTVGVISLFISVFSLLLNILSGYGAGELRQLVSLKTMPFVAGIIILQTFPRTFKILFLILMLITLLFEASATASLFFILMLYFAFFRSLSNMIIYGLLLVFPALVLINIVYPLDFFGSWVAELNPISWFTNVNQDFNANWRGFEAYLGLIQYSELSLIEQIFGAGHGSSIDLPFRIGLGGISADESVLFTDLQIIHNGFILVLYKYGLAGLVLIIYYLFSMIRYINQFANRKVSSMVITYMTFSTIAILVTFPVLSGLFNPKYLDDVVLLFGMFYGMSINWKKIEQS